MEYLRLFRRTSPGHDSPRYSTRFKNKNEFKTYKNVYYYMSIFFTFLHIKGQISVKVLDKRVMLVIYVYIFTDKISEKTGRPLLSIAVLKTNMYVK